MAAAEDIHSPYNPQNSPNFSAKNEITNKRVKRRKAPQYPPGLVIDKERNTINNRKSENLFKQTSEPINASNMEFLTKDMDEWTVQEVYEWILSIEDSKLSFVAKQLQNKQINGLMLMGVNHKYLHKLGIDKQDIQLLITSRDDILNPPSHGRPDENVESILDEKFLSELVSVGTQNLTESNSPSVYGEQAIPSPQYYQTQQPGQLVDDMNTYNKPSLNADAEEYKPKSSMANKPKLNADAIEFSPNSCSPPQQIYSVSPPFMQIEEDDMKENERSSLNIDAVEFCPDPNSYSLPRQNHNASPSDKKSEPESKAQELVDNVKPYERNVHISPAVTKLMAKVTREQIQNKDRLFDFVCLSIRLHQAAEYNNGDIRIFDFDLHDKNGQKLYCMAERPKKTKKDLKYLEWTMKNALYTQQEIKDINPYYKIPKSIRGTFDGLMVQKREISGKLKADKIISKTNWCKVPMHCELNGKLENSRRWTLSLTKEAFIKQLRENEDFMNMKDIDLIPIIVFHEDHNFHIEYVQIVTIDNERDVDIGISYTKDQKYGVYVSGIYTNKEELRNLHYLISPQHIASCRCFDKFTTTINHLAIGNPNDPQNKIKALRNSLKEHQLFYAMMKDLKQNGIRSSSPNTSSSDSLSFDINHFSSNSLEIRYN